MSAAGSIYLAFLNGYHPDWAGALLQGVGEAYPLPVHRVDLDLDLGASHAPERQQYHATLLVAGLLRHLPEPHCKIVGVTAVDLFIPVLTFVFGQSQLDGPGAIVSTHRLHPEFYGLPPDDGLLLERAIKETVHELGHAFGLVHCSDYRCVMHASTHVGEVDLKEAVLCGACRGKVRVLA